MGEKTSGAGHFQIPTAPAALTAVAQSASANTLGSAVSFGNAPSALYITGITIGVGTTQTPTYVQVQVLVAASVVVSVLVPYGVSSAAASTVVTGFRPIFPPIPVANGAAITVKTASSVASAVAWGVSLECIAQSNVVDDGVVQSSNVLQWNTTNVASPATAGIPDVNVKNINNVAAATPGAAGGVLISGSNSGTTTLGALTVTGATTLTGNVVLSDGLTISSPSTGNRAGLSIAGNGTGAGMSVTGGATGIGLSVVGGGTSGDGVKVTTTSGHGINLAPVGTSMHGLFATGGNGGTSDGIKAAAGTGGVDLRANQTGNVTGNVSGSVGSVTGLTASNLDAAVSSRMATYTQPTGFLAATFPATVASTTNITSASGVSLAASQHVIVDSGTVTTVTNQLTGAQVATAVWTDTTAGDFTTALSVGKSVINGVTLGTGLTVAAVSGAVGSVTGAVGSVTGNVGGNVVGSVASVTARVTANTDQLAGQTVTAAAGVTFPTSVASPTNITAGTITTVTNLTNAPTAGDLTATMKTSVTTAATAATPTAAAVTGNVGGNVTGSVGSVVGLTAANLDVAVSTRLSTAGYTAPDNTSITAIKAKTDSMSFTVAGRIDSNIRYVNSVAVTGAGTGGSPWGP